MSIALTGPRTTLGLVVAGAAAAAALAASSTLRSTAPSFPSVGAAKTVLTGSAPRTSAASREASWFAPLAAYYHGRVRTDFDFASLYGSGS